MSKKRKTRNWSPKRIWAWIREPVTFHIELANTIEERWETITKPWLLTPVDWVRQQLADFRAAQKNLKRLKGLEIEFAKDRDTMVDIELEFAQMLCPEKNPHIVGLCPHGFEGGRRVEYLTNEEVIARIPITDYTPNINGHQMKNCRNGYEKLIYKQSGENVTRKEHQQQSKNKKGTN